MPDEQENERQVRLAKRLLESQDNSITLKAVEEAKVKLNQPQAVCPRQGGPQQKNQETKQ